MNSYRSLFTLDTWNSRGFILVKSVTLKASVATFGGAYDPWFTYSLGKNRDRGRKLVINHLFGHKIIRDLRYLSFVGVVFSLGQGSSWRHLSKIAKNNR